jgi:hypothetical protein
MRTASTGAPRSSPVFSRVRARFSPAQKGTGLWTRAACVMRARAERLGFGLALLTKERLRISIQHHPARRVPKQFLHHLRVGAVCPITMNRCGGRYAIRSPGKGVEGSESSKENADTLANGGHIAMRPANQADLQTAMIG